MNMRHFSKPSHLHSSALVFEEGIGITRVTVSGMVGRSFLDLVDFTRGSDRTHVRPVSWGRLKMEMWER